MMWIPAVTNMIYVWNVETPLVTVINDLWNAFIPKSTLIQKRGDRQISCIIL
jgi:hypothetical protein